MPVYTPGKRYVLADQGSRQEPLATDGTLDPVISGIHILEVLLFSLKWTSLLRAPLGDHLLFSLLGSKGTPRGCLGSFFQLDAFLADICVSASCFYAYSLLESLTASRVLWLY